MASISIRKHYRTLPSGPPTEPTSTLVLTSPLRYYIDIRILTSNNTLQWGFAGRSSISSSSPPLPASPPSTSPPSAPATSHGHNNKGTYKCQWHHYLDSNCPSSSSALAVIDIGDMQPLPNGDTLETGSSINATTGLKTDYEELWTEHLPAHANEGGVVLILPSSTSSHTEKPIPAPTTKSAEDDSASPPSPDEKLESTDIRGMVIQIGPYGQGILLTDKGRIVVERWALKRVDEDGDGKWEWELVFRSGEEMEREMPCRKICEGWGMGLKEGEEVRFEDDVWKVVEVFATG